ncbi:P-loop containing nucleoside triphosphate hydrolase protein [Biscogniauxia mediterranea]|nr:P-loop containing nucleoside triphosphate hydrolase protein [Biscogniauxia mediterranea]
MDCSPDHDGSEEKPQLPTYTQGQTTRKLITLRLKPQDSQTSQPGDAATDHPSSSGSDYKKDQTQHVSLQVQLKRMVDQKDELLKMKNERPLKEIEFFALQKTEDEIEDIQRQIKEESSTDDIYSLVKCEGSPPEDSNGRNADDNDNDDNDDDDDDNAVLTDASDPDDSDYDPTENKEQEDPDPSLRRSFARDARTAHTRHNEKHEREIVFSWMAPNQRGQKRPLKTLQLRQRKRRAGQKDIGIGKLDHVDPIEAQNAQASNQDIPKIEAKTRKDLRDQHLAFSKDIHQTKASLSELGEAARRMGLGNCNPVNDKWMLKNMCYPLYPHQLLGVDFMLKRECSVYGPSGGINADAMGLGKTVEALACIVANPPQSDDIEEGRKATLWVLPASAAQQISRGVSKFCSPDAVSGPIIYHRKSLENTHGENIAKFLQDQDIIIVSYENLMADFRAVKVGEKATKKRRSTKLHVQNPPLFDMKFYRVILDEGHRTKNHNTLTHTACQGLDSKYRWLLTGTPIHNSVGELYAYCKFLGAPWTKNMTYKQFTSNFVGINEKTAHENLNAILSVIMIRRTHQDSILGQPLIRLPLAHREVSQISLSKDWKPIYKGFVKQYRITFNNIMNQVVSKDSAGAEKEAQDTRILTRILRLRELADSPMLTKHMMVHKDDIEDVQAVVSRLAKLRGKNMLYDILHDWCDAAKGLSTINEVQEICGICKNEAEVPLKVKNCGHTFCLQCISEYQGRVEDEGGKNRNLCPQCRRKDPSIGHTIMRVLSSQHKSMKAELDAISKPARESRRAKGGNGDIREPGPGEDLYYRKPNHQHKSARGLEFDMMTYGKTDAILGAKMCAVRAVISKWQSEAPTDKIIVFTHFSESSEIVGHLLRELDIKFAYFFGRLTQRQRDEIVTDFDDMPELKVLIISIKCGGEALQLTSANRVIILEPWWNMCVEEQAFGRVFRIGQEKETHLMRILMRGSIETKIDELQKKKAQDIAHTLQDSTSSETNLSLEQVARLLGRPTHDASGKIIVQSDDEDDDDEDEAEGKGDNNSSTETVQDQQMS